MDGTAAIGASNKYAAADHIHPTDTSRASQSDLAALASVVDGKADASSTYSKSDIDTALAGKQDKLTAGQNITIDSNNVISATGGGSVEQVQSDWNQSDSTKVDYIKNKPSIPTVPTNVSAFTNDAGYLTQHQSLSDYYTKTESDNALPSNPDSKTLYLIPVE